MPSVVSAATSISPGISSEKLYITANTGKTAISTSSMNSALPSILPKNIASRPTGASISACSPPLSFSSASERFSPRTPPNVNAIQSMPGATNATVCGVGLTAKLNTTMTSSANTSADTTMSFARSSSTTSFHRIAVAGRMKPFSSLISAPIRNFVSYFAAKDFVRSIRRRMLKVHCLERIGVARIRGVFVCDAPAR